MARTSQLIRAYFLALAMADFTSEFSIYIPKRMKVPAKAYFNPSQRELIALIGKDGSGQLRGLSYGEDFIVWDAFAQPLMHQDVWKWANSPGGKWENENSWTGQMDRRAPFVISRSDKVRYEGLEIPNFPYTLGRYDVAITYIMYGGEALKNAPSRMARCFKRKQTTASTPSLRAAIWYNGKAYVAELGGTHLDALQRLPADKRRDAMGDGGNRGFVTERGRYLNRNRAQLYAVKHGLIRDDAPEWAHTAPELMSEMLQKPTKE